jgi:hypothetical protein
MENVQTGAGRTEQFRAAAGQEQHGLELDYDIFEEMGALKVSRPEPHYGPRWLKIQPFYR